MTRNRGPRWSSPKQADRGRPSKSFNLSRELLARLAGLKSSGHNLSAIAEEALRAHHLVNMPPEHDHVLPV